MYNVKIFIDIIKSLKSSYIIYSDLNVIYLIKIFI